MQRPACGALEGPGPGGACGGSPARLDEATSALDAANERIMYQMIQSTGATIISVGHRPSLVPFHTEVLQLNGNGGWEIYPASFYKVRHPENA